MELIFNVARLHNISNVIFTTIFVGVFKKDILNLQKRTERYIIARDPMSDGDFRFCQTTKSPHQMTVTARAAWQTTSRRVSLTLFSIENKNGFNSPVVGFIVKRRLLTVVGGLQLYQD